ncbi:hypothetical protein [Clostridium botulinum]|uniref:hypothetical protein n=1 Tax=Clostridium botulinum TaxID=1491 RepID=UPI0022071CF4|nr:hypothetical protein [Clostridium botulinum]QDY27028.1 hypothetical protein CGQ40_20200 [Clostridium botulinum]
MSNTIKRDYRGLPKKYWKKQNFCWYMHDVILSILENCTENDKMDTKFKFRSELHAKDFEQTNDDVIDWLYKNEYTDIADNIIGKRVFHAIASDMFSFIYESLNTIEKGKITVSLALLRKPFRDNLLYLEWLLGNDSKNLIDMINEQDIEKYAIENITKYKKRDIIKSAINKVKNQAFFEEMDENTYYDLRYNYKAENSLQRAWNKANHLVTTGKHIKSEEFNFVFLDKELYLEFIDYFYCQLPHLLFYTYNVIIELYDKYIRRISNATRIYNNSLILYKFIDLSEELKPEEYFYKDKKDLLTFLCLHCKKPIRISLNGKEFNDFRNNWSFTCPICGEDINIARYIFLEDYKEKNKHLKVVK